jgi:hypothetical protein
MASNSIEEFEKKYPEIAQEYKRISTQQYSVFASKCLDYGKSNISVGTNLETPEEVKLSLTGLWFRMNDKMNRMKSLVLLNNTPNVQSESTSDTFQDLSIYSIIAQIVQNGKWK